MAKSIPYRALTPSEIADLKANGCSCSDWRMIHVANGFHPGACHNVVFSGNIHLGTYNTPLTDDSGVVTDTGIRSSKLHNCTVGSDVLISNTGEYIANYNIGDSAVLINNGRIYTEGKSSFGNGTPVAVLNESGGRVVKIWDNLSAHMAYILALYRHRTKAISEIEKAIENYSLSVTSDTGYIGKNSRITNCGTIHNVKIGDSTRIEGALKLSEGSINSCTEDPVHIGHGVIMEHFIVSSGATVSGSALVDKCFVGQGTILSKQFSAENSLFFANCEGYHGEACSVFAGPFTVTHHKSTLLIAGIFSFMNAGSGSNQSNHNYKLGPEHQGIMERGSKTSSDSYLLWPARIGPFTLVVGRHYKNPDTSIFPFSYLIESNNESLLVPAVNLRNIGTARDEMKWPRRDRRQGPDKTDQITFSILNPFTVARIISGRNELHRIVESAGSEHVKYFSGGLVIEGKSLERGINLYQDAINKFIGEAIIKRLEKRVFKNKRDLQKALSPEADNGSGEWIDVAGLITPKTEVEKLLNDIEKGIVTGTDSINDAFRHMHYMTDEMEWKWVCDAIGQEEGKPVSSLTEGDIIMLTERWMKSITKIDNLLCEDARKEFTAASMTGFGIDGNDEDRKLDFEQVRGIFENNPTILSIQEHTRISIEKGQELIKRIKNIS